MCVCVCVYNTDNFLKILPSAEMIARLTGKNWCKFYLPWRG